MILLWLILILLLGGFAAWLAERGRSDVWPRIVALLAIGLDFVLAVLAWVLHPHTAALAGPGAWLVNLNWPWISRFGIRFHLAVDGLSLLLILLTCFLGLMAVIASWTEIKYRVGFFHCHLLWTLAGVVGVFMAVDLFLFFFFWELMLVPMYFLIAIWGHQHRILAAFKFFLFTQGSGLLLLIAILGLVLVQFHNTGTLSFGYFDLLNANLAPTTAFLAMLGFFIAFAVKLPAVPFHPWLPDAHTEASTGISVILAGILLKTGAYGLIRFVIPLFPDAALAFTPVAMTLGVIGILYGAVLAFAQFDLKRLIAYSSVSHMGFVLLGIFAWNTLALQGVVVQILAHGISTPALFMIAGALQERIHTRDMRRMGGLWTNVPRMASIGLFFALASMGLPGLGNFVGEFLILLGTYPRHLFFAIVAALGLIVATLYALILVQKAFHGRKTFRGEVQDYWYWRPADLAARGTTAMMVMIVILLWLGLYPQPLFNSLHPALDGLQQFTAALASKG